MMILMKYPERTVYFFLRTMKLLKLWQTGDLHNTSSTIYRLVDDYVYNSRGRKNFGANKKVPLEEKV